MEPDIIDGYYHRPGLFSGKCAVVTGGASGIGSAASRMLAKNGARVLIIDVKDGEAAKVVSDIVQSGFEAEHLNVDITDADRVREMASFCEKNFKTVDILVNCAGISRLTGFLDISEEEWDLVLKVNLKGMFLVSQGVLDLMIRKKTRGTVINISSLAGKVGGLVVGAHYAASKAGVIALTKTMARFAARHGITVNALAPGSVRTEMIETWSDEHMQNFMNSVPLGRVAEPEEVAAVINFLASPEAGYITGEIVDVNGGILMD